MDSEFLKREGRGRGSWYHLAFDTQEGYLPNNEQDLPHKRGDLPHSELDLPHKERDLSHNGASPVQQAESPSRQGLLALDSEDENAPCLRELDQNSEILQWLKLEQIAAARRRPRMSIEDTTESHLFLGLPTFNTTTHYDENIGLRWSRAPYHCIAAPRRFTFV